ncbi:SMP-30/gluconolactonase/LRE family protein [Streptomyces tubercidicus]|uniref:SMP-30/gluconolactonase/LRE family protein n=1 Tax=Streptomyces tubercidicus TaxID=47759 RepID=UPI002E0FDE1F|nr:SMP-30/gluconolactonase/LRE family protein [Streptomyces tubercidicus]WSX24640.1 SMP-30/gluconolactonase/LRE family protein [Streptomyces tubercidicus]
MMEVERVASTGDLVGESPRWDPRTGQLVWVDMERPVVHVFTPRTGAVVDHRIPRPASSIALRDAGGYLITDGEGVRGLAASPSAGLSVGSLVVRVDEGGGSCAVNDSGCDAEGRLLVGYGSEVSPSVGRVELITPGAGAYEPSIRTLCDRMFLPNGMGWSPDGRVLYLADSYARVVHALPYDPSAPGRTAPQLGEVLYTANPDEGLPDGVAVDTDGGVWVAFWGSGTVRRFSPDGVCLCSFRLPVTQPAGVAFGGPDLSDLYITTASYGQGADDAEAGSLFRVASGTTGLPLNVCRL